MKKIMISFVLLLGGFCSFCQTIDTAALRILQKSWDKLASIEKVSYTMKTVDTMIRENQLIVNWNTIDGKIKKNEYWYLQLDNKSEWLVRGDTLYKKDNGASRSVTFSTDWERHKINSCNIHNLLGAGRPGLDDGIVSIQFVKSKASAEIYTIHVIYQNNYGTDEIKSVLRYNHYFIDKKDLLPLRRLQYGKSLQEGKEAIDIYDFSVAYKSEAPNFNPNTFFYINPEKEKERFEKLESGISAPEFEAKELSRDRAVNLSSFKGKVVLLDFWYLSCMPCRVLMPDLQKLQDKFGKDKVVVIGMNIKDEVDSEIIQFLKEKQLSYMQLYQPNKLLISDYKLTAFPTTMILDRQGKVKLVEVGVGEDTVSKLEQAIRTEL